MAQRQGTPDLRVPGAVQPVARTHDPFVTPSVPGPVIKDTPDITGAVSKITQGLTAIYSDRIAANREAELDRAKALSGNPDFLAALESLGTDATPQQQAALLETWGVGSPLAQIRALNGIGRHQARLAYIDLLERAKSGEFVSFDGSGEAELQAALTEAFSEGLDPALRGSASAVNGYQEIAAGASEEVLTVHRAAHGDRMRAEAAQAATGDLRYGTKGLDGFQNLATAESAEKALRDLPTLFGDYVINMGVPPDQAYAAAANAVRSTYRELETIADKRRFVARLRDVKFDRGQGFEGPGAPGVLVGAMADLEERLRIDEDHETDRRTRKYGSAKTRLEGRVLGAALGAIEAGEDPRAAALAEVEQARADLDGFDTLDPDDIFGIVSRQTGQAAGLHNAASEQADEVRYEEVLRLVSEGLPVTEESLSPYVAAMTTSKYRDRVRDLEVGPARAIQDNKGVARVRSRLDAIQARASDLNLATALDEVASDLSGGLESIASNTSGDLDPAGAARAIDSLVRDTGPRIAALETRIAEAEREAASLFAVANGQGTFEQRREALDRLADLGVYPDRVSRTRGILDEQSSKVEAARREAVEDIFKRTADFVTESEAYQAYTPYEQRAAELDLRRTLADQVASATEGSRSPSDVAAVLADAELGFMATIQERFPDAPKARTQEQQALQDFNTHVAAYQTAVSPDPEINNSAGLPDIASRDLARVTPGTDVLTQLDDIVRGIASGDAGVGQRAPGSSPRVSTSERALGRHVIIGVGDTLTQATAAALQAAPWGIAPDYSSVTLEAYGASRFSKREVIQALKAAAANKPDPGLKAAWQSINDWDGSAPRAGTVTEYPLADGSTVIVRFRTVTGADELHDQIQVAVRVPIPDDLVVGLSALVPRHVDAKKNLPKLRTVLGIPDSVDDERALSIINRVVQERTAQTMDR